MPTEAKTAPDDQLGFEDNLELLRTVVEQLESGELTLEQGVALYKKGLAAASHCRQALETARTEIAVLQDGLLREFSAGAEGPAGDEED